MFIGYCDSYNTTTMKKGILEFEVVKLNTSIVHRIQIHEKCTSYCPVFSQSGEYFVVPVYVSNRLIKSVWNTIYLLKI